MRRQTLTVSGLTCCGCLLALVILHVLFSICPGTAFRGYVWTVLFFGLITAGTYILMIPAFSSRPVVFFNRFLIIFGVRFLLYLVFLAAFMGILQVRSISFLVTFLILYVLSECICVTALLRHLRKNRSGKQE